MKGNKLVTLDIEIIEQLKNTENASKLINEMLIEYFFSGSDLKRDEIKGKIKLEENMITEKKQKIENLKVKLKSINEKDKEIKKVFANIPEAVLTDFRMFPKMTEEVLAVRQQNLYPNVKWEVLLKAFKEYHNGS